MNPQAHDRGAGRIETCTELISKATECLGSGDRECAMKFIAELIKAGCHNGNAVGKEVTNKVKGVIHELWLRARDNDELRCELLSMLRRFNMSKRWVKDATKSNMNTLNKLMERCGISWKSRATRNDVVKEIEDLLRRLGWSETWMCEELFKFISIDVDEFRRHGIEPCAWLEGLEELSDLKKPYWFGLRASDLAIEKYDDEIRLELKTTNTIDAIFFLKILSMIRTPSLSVKRVRAKNAKHIHEAIELGYYIDLNAGAWPWPLRLSANELERILNGFSDEELAEFVAGIIDGDGMIRIEYTKNGHQFRYMVFVEIVICKACPKRRNLDALREIIFRRFGIIGSVYSNRDSANVLSFYGEDAVRLLRRVAKYMHHPLRRLRTETVLALYDGRISHETSKKFYELTKYERGRDDIKRNHALEATTRAAPQTRTHGGIKHKPKN